MHFEAQQFKTRLQKPASWSDDVFVYCSFYEIETEGEHLTSVFVGCTFEKCEWYWGLFNCAVLVNVKFKNCTFRGTGFAGSKFVECDFSDCLFLNDNLGGSCYFSDTAWYKCTQVNCPGLKANLEAADSVNQGNEPRHVVKLPPALLQSMRAILAPADADCSPHLGPEPRSKVIDENAA